jgi:membrane protease YdiL (CAAX protease family)
VPPSRQRDFAGWITLAVIFLLLIAQTFAPQPASSKIDLGEAQTTLRTAVGNLNSPNPVLSQIAKTSLGDLETKFVANSKSDPVAAEVFLTCRSLQGEKLDPVALKAIASSKDPVDQDAAKAFGQVKPDLKTAARLSANFGKRGFLGDVMKAQLYAKAGDKRLMMHLADQANASLALIVGMYLLLVSGSFGAWIYLLSLKASGRLFPKGIAVKLPVMYDADRLAIRAAQLIALFLLLSIIPGAFEAASHVNIDSRFEELFVGVAMLIAVPFLFKLPVKGRIFTLADIGFRRETLARDVKLGLFGFLIEFPLAMALNLIGQALFSRFHQPTHPAATALENSHDWLSVASILVAASVVAPFWEEIMFRGLLFPALSKATGKVVYGVVISSFLFGAIHPQGFPLWMALMSLACVSCALSYYTNSLVPSMFMHAAHNSVIVALALLLS